jgi:hypothetical protein
VVDTVPTMSDVFVLRPFKVSPEAATDTRFADDSPATSLLGDRTTTYQLETGDFALLSRGPDRSLNERARWDYGNWPEEGLNEDNIVEVGP